MWPSFVGCPLSIIHYCTYPSCLETVSFARKPKMRHDIATLYPLNTETHPYQKCKLLIWSSGDGLKLKATPLAVNGELDSPVQDTPRGTIPGLKSRQQIWPLLNRPGLSTTSSFHSLPVLPYVRKSTRSKRQNVFICSFFFLWSWKCNTFMRWNVTIDARKVVRIVAIILSRKTLVTVVQDTKLMLEVILLLWPSVLPS